MTAAEALARAIETGSGSRDGPHTFLGVVTAVSATQVTVIPDSSPSFAVGPISVVGTAMPLVGDRVLCLMLEEGATVCLGSVGPTVSSGGGGGDLVKIGEVVLGADAADITWSSIPQTFRALKIIAQLRSSVATDHGQIAMRFNGDAGFHYDNWLADGFTSWSLSTFDSDGFGRPGQLPGATATAGNFSSTEITIPSYRSANRKSWHSLSGAPENDAGSGASTYRTDVGSGVWKTTAAITSISLKDRSGANLVAGSEAVLYGLN